MFSGFLIIFFVELADEFFKDSTHAVIIKGWVSEDGLCCILVNRSWTEIDIGRDKFLNHRAEYSSINHGIYLIAEFEFLKYLLNIGRKTVKISNEVGFHFLLIRAAGKVFQKERRDIAECDIRFIDKSRPLVIDLGIIKCLFHSKHFFLGILKHDIKTPNDGHRQNNITVFASYIYITEAVISDAPYKIDDLVISLIFHSFSFLGFSNWQDDPCHVYHIKSGVRLYGLFQIIFHSYFKVNCSGFIGVAGLSILCLNLPHKFMCSFKVPCIKVCGNSCVFARL